MPDEHTQTATGAVPRIGEPAIPFKVRTTLGERSLADFAGRWLLFFSHPADFTPVCTSEFIAFSQAQSRFEALDCDLLGLSVDSLFSHLAWVASIREKFGVTIGFPLAEDISMSVAAAYGMIHPGDSDTSAVRATFLIDPAGIIRFLSFYPLSIGRSVDEILRILAALQESDSSGLSTPEGWVPGQNAVTPPPLTVAEADARAARGATTWYYEPHPVTR